MIAAATTASAGSGASPAAASVPPFDAWGVDAHGATEPRGSHHTVEAALRAGDVVIHAREVVTVRPGAPAAAVDRIVRDVLDVDLRALRGLISTANSVAGIAAAWTIHASALARLGDDIRTALWIAAVARAQECVGRGDAAGRLRAAIDSRVTAPES